MHLYSSMGKNEPEPEPEVKEVSILSSCDAEEKQLKNVLLENGKNNDPSVDSCGTPFK